MVVGALSVRLLIRESYSLKDKRQVVRSIKDRLRHAFNISIAEVDALDERQTAVLGITMVGNEVAAVQATLQEITQALRAHPVAEFVKHEMSIQHEEDA
jgi:uncharacterized protein YlxP (DUF503 family)